jgi:hypothetical protein
VGESSGVLASFQLSPSPASSPSTLNPQTTFSLPTAASSYALASLRPLSFEVRMGFKSSDWKQFFPRAVNCPDTQFPMVFTANMTISMNVEKPYENKRAEIRKAKKSVAGL